MLGLHVLVWSCCLTFFSVIPNRSSPNSSQLPQHIWHLCAWTWTRHESLGHADVLHKVCSDSTIEDIICLLRTYQDDKKMYNPAKGLYWLRKGKEQLVSLKSPEDLQTCKDEYKGNLCLACHTVSLEKSSDIIAFNLNILTVVPLRKNKHTLFWFLLLFRGPTWLHISAHQVMTNI